MRSLLISVAVAASVLAGHAGLAHAENAVVAKAVTGFVRPAYADLQAAADALRNGVSALCVAPSAEGLALAQEKFAATVTAWSTVEIIRFGPVMEDNRIDRMLFWPDRKSIGLKQVQAALASRDASATDVASLQGKSVAMQGLGALEFVLFGTGSEALAAPGDEYRCAYGLAVAGNVEAIAAAISAEWRDDGGFAARWTNPSADNPLYRNDAESLNELLGVFVHGLEMVRDVRINGFLGRSAAQDKPRQAVFWRAEATVPSIAANMRGLSRLFAASGLPEAMPANDAWLAQSAMAQFANADRVLGLAEGPLDAALASPEKREALAHAKLITSSLSNLFGVRISGSLGLTAGFSSLDGD